MCLDVVAASSSNTSKLPIVIRDKTPVFRSSPSSLMSRCRRFRVAPSASTAPGANWACNAAPKTIGTHRAEQAPLSPASQASHDELKIEWDGSVAGHGVVTEDELTYTHSHTVQHSTVQFSSTMQLSIAIDRSEKRPASVRLGPTRATHQVNRRFTRDGSNKNRPNSPAKATATRLCSRVKVISSLVESSMRRFSLASRDSLECHKLALRQRGLLRPVALWVVALIVTLTAYSRVGSPRSPARWRIFLFEQSALDWRAQFDS